MDAKLIIVGGKASKDKIALKLPTIIGRSREATLTVAHPMISRQHCELYEVDGLLMIRDMGSMNGTVVGDQRVKEAPLPPNAEFTVGPLTFRAEYQYKGNLKKLPAAVLADAAADTGAVPDFQALDEPMPFDLNTAAAADAGVKQDASFFDNILGESDSSAEPSVPPKKAATPTKPKPAADDFIDFLNEEEEEAEPEPTPPPKTPRRIKEPQPEAAPPPEPAPVEDAVEETTEEEEAVEEVSEITEEDDAVEEAFQETIEEDEAFDEAFEEAFEESIEEEKPVEEAFEESIEEEKPVEEAFEESIEEEKPVEEAFEESIEEEEAVEEMSEDTDTVEQPAASAQLEATKEPEIAFEVDEHPTAESETAAEEPESELKKKKASWLSTLIERWKKKKGPKKEKPAKAAKASKGKKPAKSAAEPVPKKPPVEEAAAPKEPAKKVSATPAAKPEPAEDHDFFGQSEAESATESKQDPAASEVVFDDFLEGLK